MAERWLRHWAFISKQVSPIGDLLTLVPTLKLLEKLAILADAAKYDASCASSGSERRDSRVTGGIGSTEAMGICHSYAPDGRCISLLKILLTNFCMFECSYCVNRASSNVPRARFTPAEVVRLTLEFYKRNYIEGLFLSSGIIQSPDYTMENMVAVARSLRLDHQFGGYIHLKTIPEASPELLAEAGLYADRLSINVELPTIESLRRLAPEKNTQTIETSMLRLRNHIDEYQSQKVAPRRARQPAVKFSPAGQSTQMIVGADATDDATILKRADSLYGNYKLKRVYYSAFSPIPDASIVLPPTAPPLAREHRLYQADWLLRFYEFGIDELVGATSGNGGMLDLDVDPKLAWALNNRHLYPVDLNRAEREVILRVPGIGIKTADRICAQRRLRKVSLQDLKRLRVSLPKVKPFIETVDYRPRPAELESSALRQTMISDRQQLSLF